MSRTKPTHCLNVRPHGSTEPWVGTLFPAIILWIVFVSVPNFALSLPACLALCVPGDTPETSSDSPAQMAPGVRVKPREETFLEEIGRVEPPAVTFLETYVLTDRTAVLVKHPDGKVEGVVVEIGAKTLENLIASYRHALDVDAARGVKTVSPIPDPSAIAPAETSSEREIARQIYRLLINPVNRLLPQNPRETVVIVPHDSLWLLPFAALRDENDRFFGDQHVLTYAMSEETWKRVATRPRSADHRNASAWVVGNPDMSQAVAGCGTTYTLAPLSGAEQEAKAIAELFGRDKANLFIGPQADRLRLDAWHPDFSVLHFATHGLACPSDPLSSFIVLKELRQGDLNLDPRSKTLSLRTDSRFSVALVDPFSSMLGEPLRSPEIREMSIPSDGRGPSFPGPVELSYPGLLDARTIIGQFNLNADLVTLSACQTGLGQLSVEGMIGFTRAFLAAGSRSLMVSLWRVDDRATKDLMVRFYRDYLGHGNKGLAFQRAMAETRKQIPGT